VAARAGLRGVLAVREFRALTLAWVVSLVGDQLARVAISVLVYARTGSPLLSALVYAVTFLPALVGGPLLAGLADRQPRRRVMVAADLARAALVLIMAVPGCPLAVLLALLFVVTALDAPFATARAPLLKTVLEGSDYRAGLGFDVILGQLAQVLGFLGGGALLTLVTSSQALLLDAGTYLASTALLLAGVRAAPAPAQAARQAGGVFALALSDARAGLTAVLADPQRRLAVVLTWIVLIGAIAPEGLAVPWALHLHGGTVAAGLLLGAQPVGQVLALAVVTRAKAPPPAVLLRPLTLLTALPLVLCLLDPPLVPALLLLLLCGMGTAVSALAQILFIEATPDAIRGRAFAIASTGVTAAQGLGLVLGGALAEALSPPTAVGVIGVMSGLGAAFALRKHHGSAAPAP